MMANVFWKLAGCAIGATALIVASAQWASAEPARLGTRTNLRMGPGTNFGIVTTMPAGAVVNVIRCGPEWCNVTFAGRPGYVIARNLGGGAPPVVAGGPPPPPVVVVEPAPPMVVVGPRYGFYGPRYFYGPRWGWRRW
jgi:hypothetical protein